MNPDAGKPMPSAKETLAMMNEMSSMRPQDPFDRMEVVREPKGHPSGGQKPSIFRKVRSEKQKAHLANIAKKNKAEKRKKKLKKNSKKRNR